MMFKGDAAFGVSIGELEIMKYFPGCGLRQLFSFADFERARGIGVQFIRINRLLRSGGVAGVNHRAAGKRYQKSRPERAR